MGFLGQHLRLDGIRDAVRQGGLRALGITTTGYHSARLTFVEGQPDAPLWNKSRRLALGLKSDCLTFSHRPPSRLYFPVTLPVGLGVPYFGDGRDTAGDTAEPCHTIGADRLLAIGVRCQESADDLMRSEWNQDADLSASFRIPPLSQIFGTLMNAIFLDHLDADLEHLMHRCVCSRTPKLAALVDDVPDSIEPWPPDPCVLLRRCKSRPPQTCDSRNKHRLNIAPFDI